ncbi:MAG: ankyrin repeat domain-containing protein [Anaerolineales bacterium]
MLRHGLVLLMLLFSMAAFGSEAGWQTELNASLEGRLLLAVADGERDQVESLLESGADPNKVLPGMAPPLVAAIRGRHMGIADLLLDRGAHADDSGSVKGANTSLTEAIAGKHIDLAIRLVEGGANINLPSRFLSGSTPFETVTLHYFHKPEFRELFYVMLDHDPQVNRIYRPRSTVLLDAIRNDNIQIMIDLLRAGADPNMKVSGMSALYSARQGNDIHIKQEMLKALVHYGADIRQAGYLGDADTGTSVAGLFLQMEPPEVYCIVLPEHDTCR